MKKERENFSFFCKNKATKCWMITSIILVILMIVVLIATQVDLVSNSIDLVIGGGDRYLKSGDPSKYMYYNSFYNKDTEKNNGKKTILLDANKLNEEIVGEGITLLKNDNNVLPLEKTEKISVFGKNSVNFVYGGSGSAGSNSDGTTTLFKSLASAGFECNPTLKSFYEDNKKSGEGRPSGNLMGKYRLAGLPTGETPQSSYTEDVKESYKNYKDVAMIVISRMGGEGFDLPRTSGTFKDDNVTGWDVKNTGDVVGLTEGRENNEEHYLQLDKNEKDLIKATKEVGFSKIIVIVNCTQTMELGDLQDDKLINSILWVGASGRTGINSVGEILNGDINPSGRTVDTYAKDFRKDPTWQNFGSNNNYHGNEYVMNGQPISRYYVEYEEGIYVGYRYYETRGFTDGEEWYDNNVVYPFGYGLSYTTFDQEIENKSELDNLVVDKSTELKVVVKVKNTGDRPGKSVVQLYYTAPYYDGEIEKSHVVLGGFSKTKLLEKDESQEIVINLKISDFASYDYNDANKNNYKGYELDPGDYQIKLMKNAHEEIDHFTCKILGSSSIQLKNDSATNTEIKNLFDDVSFNENGIKTYLSRSDWTKTFPTMPSIEDRTININFFKSIPLKYDVNNVSDEIKVDDKNIPTYSEVKQSYEKTKVKLYDLIEFNENGKKIETSYKNENWDKLLDQLTIKEMCDLIGTGSFNTNAISRIEKPKTIDPDGPVGFTVFMNLSEKTAPVYNTEFYACGCMIAATYNRDLAFEMGKMIGEESLLGNLRGDGTTYSGWYAPAVNIHRSPFGGRNWEYMSEDGYLSGEIASGIIKGAKEKGVYTYLKHFALNDQETNRETYGLLTWANEQSMRELYFKPFEISVKEGKTNAIMSSFNRIGTTWAGGDYQLLTKLLREEWGFKGMVITDYNVYDYMNSNQMIHAGGDLSLSQDKKPSDDKNATQITALRKATKNILYTVVNSNAMNGYGPGVVYAYSLAKWRIALIIVDVLLVAIIVAWGTIITLKNKKK